MAVEQDLQTLSAEQVLEDIKKELTTTPKNEVDHILQAIAEARQKQKDLRANPVIGQFRGIKRLFYSMNHSTFSQLFELNDTLLDLVETLYNEIYQYREAQIKFHHYPPEPDSSSSTSKTEVSGD